MRVVASSVVSVSLRKCSRLLEPGELKRVPQLGPLVGYFIACPACGFPAPYLDDEVGYVEEPPKEKTLYAGSPQRELRGLERPPRCFRCKLLLRVELERLEACED